MQDGIKIARWRQKRFCKIEKIGHQMAPKHFRKIENIGRQMAQKTFLENLKNWPPGGAKNVFGKL